MAKERNQGRKGGDLWAETRAGATVLPAIKGVDQAKKQPSLMSVMGKKMKGK